MDTLIKPSTKLTAAPCKKLDHYYAHSHRQADGWTICDACACYWQDIKRGEVKVGDTVWSSHYGIREVASINWSGIWGHHMGMTFVSPGETVMGERYDSNTTMPLVSRA